MNRGLKEKIIGYYLEGKSYSQICKILSCSKGTISYHLKIFSEEKRNEKRGLKKILLSEIKDNLPKNKYEFIEKYGDKLTRTEIRTIVKDFYQIHKHPVGIIDGKVPKEYYQNKRYWMKKEMVDYKGGKCEICKYDKSLRALQFHHIDPKLKKFEIGGCFKLTEKVKEELDKCMLLCSNCHSEIHDNNLNK